MIPIPGFDSIEINWIAIQRENFVLYGCLLYLASDHDFYEYMNSDGLLDFEHWTGDDLAVFVVQAPSQKWIEYTRTENHIWWKLFGERTEFLQDYQDVAVLQTDKGIKTLREVFAPCLNEFLHEGEIAKILEWFGLSRPSHPCILLFKDFYNSNDAWYIDCRDMLNIPKQVLHISLNQWFDGPYFKKIMKEARNA